MAATDLNEMLTVPGGVPNTEVTGAVWAALNNSAGATSAELAIAAKKSRSATDKALVLLEKAGAASRTKSTLRNGRGSAARWRAIKVPQAVEDQDAAETSDDDQPAADAENQERAPIAYDLDGEAAVEPTHPTVAGTTPAASVPGQGERLRRGELRLMVMEYFSAHPDQDWTATAVGRGLGRSPGAVFNACETLVATGAIARTSTKPRRFRTKHS